MKKLAINRKIGNWDHEFQADDGLKVRVRRQCPEDAKLLVELFQHLSSDSRYHRFHETLINPDPLLVQSEALRLASVDPAEGRAWLAMADLPGEANAPIAGARYVRTGPGTAEVAVAVRDDLQRRGIGSRLMKFVFEQAVADGIQKIQARFHANNQGIWQLFHYSPFHVTWEMQGSEVDATFFLSPRSHELDGD